MSTTLAGYSPQLEGYRRGQKLSPRGRLIVWIAIGGLHVAALIALLIVRAAPAPPEPAVLQVRMIAETQVVPVEPPPPPPEPVKPKPQPRLVSTPKPTPSAIATPPPVEEPVTEAVAETFSPPAPPAAPAVPVAEEPIIPPNFVAAYLNNPPPVYPYSAKLRRETGEVRLRVLVSAEGRAAEVRIERSSGSASLDSAARDIVLKRWRFVAAKRGEETVAAWVIVPILFELRQ